jgi:hypothetical protein
MSSVKIVLPPHLNLANGITIFMFTYLILIEAAGIFHILHSSVIIISFALAILIGIQSSSNFSWHYSKETFKSFKNIYRSHQILDWQTIQVWAILVTLFALSIVALLATPNNWDSMTYQIPRMEHWFQNHSLWFYNTNIDRQLWIQGLNSRFFLLPKALHLPDSFFNLIQLIALISILVLIWKVFGHFQVSKQFALSIILIFLTLPNVLAEAPTTQSDLVAALVALLNFIYLLELVNKNLSSSTFYMYGMTFAMTAFAKGTLFPYLAVSAITAIWVCRSTWIKLNGIRFFSFIPLTILLNGFLWFQTFRMFGAITGPKSTPTRFIQSPIASGFDPFSLLSSFMHFLVYNMQSYFPAVNEALFKAAFRFANFLHIDLLSEGTSWPNWNPSSNTFTYIFNPAFGVNEDSAVSPQYIFIFFALLFAALKIRKSSKAMSVLGIRVALAYFCGMIFIFRWNPFVARYFIAAAVIGLVALGLHFRANNRVTKVMTVISLLCVIYSLPFTFRSDIRPLIGQQSIFKITNAQQQFLSRPNLLQEFQNLDAAVSRVKPTSIELSIGGDDWEYPIWKLATKFSIPIWDYRDAENLKGNKPLLICYVDCKLATLRSNTYIIQKPILNELKLNQTVNFIGSKNREVLLQGWADPESWGVWSNANTAVMKFDVAPNFFKSEKLSFYVRTLHAQTIQPRIMKLRVNDVYFKSFNLNQIQVYSRIEIPGEYLSELKPSNNVIFTFEFENLKSPSGLNLGNDSRLLGIGVYSLVVESQK